MTCYISSMAGLLYVFPFQSQCSIASFTHFLASHWLDELYSLFYHHFASILFKKSISLSLAFNRLYNYHHYYYPPVLSLLKSSIHSILLFSTVSSSTTKRKIEFWVSVKSTASGTHTFSYSVKKEEEEEKFSWEMHRRKLISASIYPCQFFRVLSFYFSFVFFSFFNVSVCLGVCKGE